MHLPYDTTLSGRRRLSDHFGIALQFVTADRLVVPDLILVESLEGVDVGRVTQPGDHAIKMSLGCRRISSGQTYDFSHC